MLGGWKYYQMNNITSSSTITISCKSERASAENRRREYHGNFAGLSKSDGRQSVVVARYHWKHLTDSMRYTKEVSLSWTNQFK